MERNHPVHHSDQIYVAGPRRMFLSLNLALRLLTVGYLIGLAHTYCAQTPDAQTVTDSTSAENLRYIREALQVGSAITIALGIMKGIAEWTAAGRKNKALERVARLATLIDATTKVSFSEECAAFISGIRVTAEEEFMRATDRCYRPKSVPSKIRRAFLIYLPPRPWAYVPHFFFFSLCSLVVFGFGSEVLDKTADMKDFIAFLSIACLIYFMQRWAAFEWRKSRAIELTPIHLKYGVCWYPANTFLGLVANSLGVNP